MRISPETRSLDSHVKLDGFPLGPVLFLDPGSGGGDILVVTRDPGAAGLLKLTRHSLGAAGAQWSIHFGEADWPRTDGEPPVNWPYVADLDSDGEMEIVLPCETAQTARPLTLNAFRADTGRSIWPAPRKIALRGPAFVKRIFQLPDVTGDGVSEVASFRSVKSPGERRASPSLSTRSRAATASR